MGLAFAIRPRRDGAIVFKIVPLKEQQVMSYKHNLSTQGKATLDRGATPGGRHHLVTHVRDCKTSLAGPNGRLTL